MKRLKELFVFVWALNISVVSAQTFQKMTIEEMFEMADANSRSIRTFRLAEEEAGQAVKVAKNAQLPSIDVSVSASYLGDAWLADRDFTNGENAAMPHFGNNFAIVRQTTCSQCLRRLLKAISRLLCRPDRGKGSLSDL